MPPLAIAKDMEGDLSKAMEIGIKAAQSSIDAYNFQLNRKTPTQAIALQQQRELESQKAQLEQLKMVRAQQAILNSNRDGKAASKQRRNVKRQEEMWQQQAAYAQNPNNPQNQVYMNSQMQQGMMSGQGHTGGPGSLLAVQVPPGMGPNDAAS